MATKVIKIKIKGGLIPPKPGPNKKVKTTVKKKSSKNGSKTMKAKCM